MKAKALACYEQKVRLQKLNEFFELCCYFCEFAVYRHKGYSMAPNIEALSAAEAMAWKAYYEKDLKMLFSSVEKIFEIQFALSPLQAREVTAHYAKAAAEFGNLPTDTPRADYQRLVLPILVNAYAVLNSYSPMKDYERIAQFDLEWWVDRRDPKTNSPAIVGSSMAKMYAAMDLDANIMLLEKAAYLRAAAGQYRDLTHQVWGGMTSQDWTIVQQILLNGYKVLYPDVP